LALLITKNYVLALANAFFHAKNTKKLKGVVSCKKNTTFSKYANFSVFLVLPASENNFFQIQYQKLSIDKLLNRLLAVKYFHGGALNRTESNTFRSIL
jgi:hypothetical protein